METFGCLEAEMALKDVWKCAAEATGALSVEICGMTWMQKLCATSLDFRTQVSFHIRFMDCILVASPRTI